MKLQISFDTTDLQKTIEIAKEIDAYADIFEIGTLLIYTYGQKSLEQFREAFPEKTILADTKIIDRGRQVVEQLAPTKINWLTVMAGTSKNVIHTTCTHAHEKNIKVMLDLLDTSSLGQAALEAKTLGADALLFHQPYDEQETLVFLDKWDMIKGNTTLPIFVSAKINRDNVHEVMNINPNGLIIGKSITDADDPVEEAKFFYELVSKA